MIHPDRNSSSAELGKKTAALPIMIIIVATRLEQRKLANLAISETKQRDVVSET
jgi:hypothetical protein